MLTMYQQITIKTLSKQGVKQTEIARELGCHRNTVRNIIHKEKVTEKQTRSKSSYFDPYHGRIKEWLDKKVSNLRIYELLKEMHGISRTYDSLCKYIQKEFPKTPEAFGVQVTGPGEEAEVDFGYAGLQPVNIPGTSIIRAKTWVLVVKLSHSRSRFHQITRDQKITTLTAGITAAFEYFGGVPKRLKIDNLKAAILNNQHYDLQYNQSFLEWAQHFGCVVNPCTPYSPEQKGKVEAEVKYIKNNFLVERTFTDWNDLVNQLKHWTNDYANRKVHSVTRQIPWDVLLEVERKTLMPLPETSYSTFEQAERTVGKNCHLFFKNNYYSAPSFLVGKTVTIRFADNILRIINKGIEVACHTISAGTGQYITSRSHLPEYKCYGVTEYQKKYEAKMADIGEYAHTYFKEILLKRDSYWFRSARIILGLAHKHGNEAVNFSLKRAFHYKVLNISIITHIVEQQLYRLDISPRLLKSQVLSSPDEPTSRPPSSSSFLNQVMAVIKNQLNGSSPPPEPAPYTVSTDIQRDLSYYQQVLERNE